ncbi:hypothetical protein QBC36DRAFT_307398 [Triangularia setosa]|uniref:Uncharacterized protein n=1 Tax=Triangularia setosa TaxID=2587417 RepID=A0AAN6WFQ8_9PEZI|nr:hypothetical protein QBC36DRAFT_307398 [Podospora setosa]
MADLDSHPAYLLGRGQVSPLITPKSLAEQLKRDPNDGADVIVMHGLPPKYLDVLLVLGGSDLGFLESFAARREYRPFARSELLNCQEFPSNERQWCILEYPELVQGFKPLRLEKDETDTVHPPPVKALPSSNGKTFVVFCRMALRISHQGKLLLLDNPIWRRSWQARKAPWKTPVSYFLDPNGLASYSEINEAGSFEQSLVSILNGETHHKCLTELLLDLAYDRWMELFEFLESPSHPVTDDTMAFWWQVLRSLELNEEEGSPCWRRLLDRVQRRISLLSLPTSKRPVPLKSASVPMLPISPTSHSSPRSPVSRRSAASTPAAILTPQPLLQPKNDVREKTVTRFSTPSTALRAARLRRALAYHPSAEENRRALDRISYMGGILIPLPIISGILSMGEIFGPSGPRFWIFWAVSIPLAVISVLIIYADTIRKAEVWVEVAPELVVSGRSPERFSVDSEGGMSDGPVDVEVQEHRTVTWRRHHHGEGHGSSSGEGLQQRPQASHDPGVVFVLNHDIEERIIGLPPETAAMATAAVDPEWDEDIDDAVLDVLPPGRKKKRSPIILQRSEDGQEKPKAWKRQELGWYGAMKSVMWKKPRALEDVPDGVVAYEKPGKKKSKTF